MVEEARRHRTLFVHEFDGSERLNSFELAHQLLDAATPRSRNCNNCRPNSIGCDRLDIEILTWPLRSQFSCI
jgi:hypothetical protein